MQIENELRNKNEQLLTQSRQVEFLNRQKDEDILVLKRHVDKAETDLKSLTWLESQLKNELSAMKKQKIDLEDKL